ncbi:MAG TPA: serine hydrolase domain-containing protein [Chitinophagaceae bacterium]|nr:serine hydrolase domain-containing protein [Chitinophagaceae bacterium]
MKQRIVLIAALLLSVCISVDAQQQYFVSGGRKVDIKQFDREINTMLDGTGVPGVSLAVIENNKVVYANNYGYKQLSTKAKVDKKTVFEACSLSKIFLVYVAHMLVDKGLLDLDKPMYQYLEYKPLAHDDRYKLITPRMVLSHSSGIENWRWYNNEDTLEILSDPGQRFVYSGEGFQYLAKVIEKIINEPYENYTNRMVVEPLQLRDTYLKYKDNSPADYAIGYTDFGTEIEKWKNLQPVPASGIHLTGEDFAKLIVAIFDRQHLSEARIKDLMKPVVRMKEDDASFHMGAGFSMIYTPKDTIVSFSGSNEGFKAQIFYSVINKRGFVFLTNSDLGNMITAKVCDMSARLDLQSIFRTSLQKPYPSTAFSLLKTYRDKNADAMFADIQLLKRAGKLDDNTLNELANLFVGHDKAIAKKLLEENLAVYPNSAMSYCLLGRIYFEMKEYTLAYNNLKKAKDLNFTFWNIDGPLKAAEQLMSTNNK